MFIVEVAERLNCSIISSYTFTAYFILFILVDERAVEFINHCINYILQLSETEMNGINMEKYFMERERFRVLENIDAQRFFMRHLISRSYKSKVDAFIRNVCYHF